MCYSGLCKRSMVEGCKGVPSTIYWNTEHLGLTILVVLESMKHFRGDILEIFENTDYFGLTILIVRNNARYLGVEGTAGTGEIPGILG